ncbi:PGPGW domain-containing protein [Nocardioides mesophilus]|uniref:PGPGW domain-containing protein n=1 Tax=Nocardioides mesophilus TaxID=433659 RepID=A0A7G9RA78_9ACTN|nr:PGPGW domain-containing protein [Nocardioides mesophilus]QNN52503.1 PGPGW domain-containing protein [Nocardioides mesophilus]
MTDNATDVSQENPDSGRRLGGLHRKLHAHPVLSLVTKTVVAVVGGLVTLAGVVMIVTPGPAFVLIPLGLAILATEFAFARRWLDWARRKAEEAKRRNDALDPAVRRRRLLLTGLAILVLVGAVTWYVLVYDWPLLAVDGWDWVQSLAGWVPDLPGM